MRLFFSFIALLLLICSAFGQTTETFSDGDFTTNPTWQGNTSEFIVNASGQLQLNNSIAGTSYLSIPHGLIDLTNKEWQIYVKQSIASSTSNFGRVYLCADNSNLTLAQNGYYLQFGEANATDAIRLFKLEAGISTQICAGIDGQIANSFISSVRVKRNAIGDWELAVDFSGGGNYIFQASGNDPSNLIGNSFGVLCTYTASNATKFYYDNVYIGNEIIDIIVPVVDTAIVISQNQVDVYFNEAISTASANLLTNYSLTPFQSISNAVQDGANLSLVHLTLTNSLVNGTTYTLNTANIADLVGNVGGNQSINFDYLVAEIPLKGDVIINEFFADPTPVIGLPEVEYVEIYNKSNKIFNIQNWRITDGSATGTIANAWLMPGEYLVLAATSSIPLFSPMVPVGVTSFPSLNNAGDSIILKDDNGVFIDYLVYTDDWYQDDVKKDGGYSLELINPLDPCSDGDNWTASTWIMGGTPGAVNSVYNITPDTDAPNITQLIALAPNYVEVHFDEGMDSTSLANAIIQTVAPLTIQNRYVNGNYPNQFTLQFIENLQSSVIYNITIASVADCWMNTTNLSGEFVLTETPQKGDIIINEILQNPLNGGYDWIELYNNSQKMFNLKNMELANFDNDTIANNKIIPQDFILKPGGYAVVGKDSVFVKQNYPFSVAGTFVYSELPSYNNDSGQVYLISNYQVIDSVSYYNSWQFKLLDDVDGVSLERIDPNGPSSSPYNWHSAAESVGFGTPGRINSQYLPALTNGEINLTNEVFSPDNDGFEDVLQFSYVMTKEGLLGKATLYDDRGRVVRSLFSNEYLGTSGAFSWDGITDTNFKASIGVYVLLFEAFSIDGGVFYTAKKALTLAGKL